MAPARARCHVQRSTIKFRPLALVLCDLCNPCVVPVTQYPAPPADGQPTGGEWTVAVSREDPSCEFTLSAPVQRAGPAPAPVPATAATPSCTDLRRLAPGGQEVPLAGLVAAEVFTSLTSPPDPASLRSAAVVPPADLPTVLRSACVEDSRIIVSGLLSASSFPCHSTYQVVAALPPPEANVGASVWLDGQPLAFPGCDADPTVHRCGTGIPTMHTAAIFAVATPVLTQPEDTPVPAPVLVTPALLSSPVPQLPMRGTSSPESSPLPSTYPSPVLSPMHTPLASPRSSPLQSPQNSPLPSPLVTPVASPMAFPLQSPLPPPLLTPAAVILSPTVLKTPKQTRLPEIMDPSLQPTPLALAPPVSLGSGCSTASESLLLPGGSKLLRLEFTCGPDSNMSFVPSPSIEVVNHLSGPDCTAAQDGSRTCGGFSHPELSTQGGTVWAPDCPELGLSEGIQTRTAWRDQCTGGLIFRQPINVTCHTMRIHADSPDGPVLATLPSGVGAASYSGLFAAPTWEESHSYNGWMPFWGGFQIQGSFSSLWVSFACGAGGADAVGQPCSALRYLDDDLDSGPGLQASFAAGLAWGYAALSPTEGHCESICAMPPAPLQDQQNDAFGFPPGPVQCLDNCTRVATPIRGHRMSAGEFVLTGASPPPPPLAPGAVVIPLTPVPRTPTVLPKTFQPEVDDDCKGWDEVWPWFCRWPNWAKILLLTVLLCCLCCLALCIAACVLAMLRQRLKEWLEVYRAEKEFKKRHPNNKVVPEDDPEDTPQEPEPEPEPKPDPEAPCPLPMDTARKRRRKKNKNASRKVKIYSATRTVQPDFAEDTVNAALEAMEMYRLEPDISAHVVESIQEKYPPGWQCIAGTDLKSYAEGCIAPSAEEYIHFKCGAIDLLLFKQPAAGSKTFAAA
eukprot:gene1032-2624_t